jgi:hypothetical protein
MTRTARRRSRLLLGAVALAATALGTVLTTPPGAAGDAGTLRLAAAPGEAPGPVSIATVPPVAGFAVTLDGVTKLTDDAGKAVMETGSGPDLAERLSLPDSSTSMIGGQKVLVRPARVYVSDRSVQIAMDLDYFVQFHFQDTDGTQLDAAGIDTVVVKSETGEVVEVPAATGSWLRGNRVVGGSGAPRVRYLAWSVQEIEYAGSNLVNASQQRFVPAEQQDVTVDLLFFGMSVHMHDAFFGFPQTGAVELEYPDGSTRRFDLGDDGQLAIPALPRGAYELTPVGPGPRMSRPLAISRAQEVDLAFYSWLDILALLAVLAGLAGGLAYTGGIRRGPRPPRHRHRHRHRPPRSRRPRSEHTDEAAPGDRRPAGHRAEPFSDAAVGAG